MFGLVALLVGCGSSHRALYSGHLYSVADVKQAFAQFGWKLHGAPPQEPGIVTLRGTWDEPGQSWSGTRAGTVEVATRPTAIGGGASAPGRRTTFANVIVFDESGDGDIVRGAFSALRWGTLMRETPRGDLIVPGKSIGLFRLDEPRTAVETAFGPGVRGRYRGEVSYPGKHLTVSYEFHDGIYNRVMSVSTAWPGYRTKSGVHVGSSAQALRRLFVTCEGKKMCYVLEGPWPDALATTFPLRNGKVASISFGGS